MYLERVIQLPSAVRLCFINTADEDLDRLQAVLSDVFPVHILRDYAEGNRVSLVLRAQHGSLRTASFYQGWVQGWIAAQTRPMPLTVAGQLRLLPRLQQLLRRPPIHITWSIRFLLNAKGTAIPQHSAVTAGGCRVSLDELSVTAQE